LVAASTAAAVAGVLYACGTAFVSPTRPWSGAGDYRASASQVAMRHAAYERASNYQRTPNVYEPPRRKDPSQHPYWKQGNKQLVKPRRIRGARMRNNKDLPYKGIRPVLVRKEPFNNTVRLTEAAAAEKQLVEAADKDVRIGTVLRGKVVEKGFNNFTVLIPRLDVTDPNYKRGFSWHNSGAGIARIVTVIDAAPDVRKGTEVELAVETLTKADPFEHGTGELAWGARKQVDIQIGAKRVKEGEYPSIELKTMAKVGDFLLGQVTGFQGDALTVDVPGENTCECVVSNTRMGGYMTNSELRGEYLIGEWHKVQVKQIDASGIRKLLIVPMPLPEIQ